MRSTDYVPLWPAEWEVRLYKPMHGPYSTQLARTSICVGRLKETVCDDDAGQARHPVNFRVLLLQYRNDKHRMKQEYVKSDDAEVSAVEGKPGASLVVGLCEHVFAVPSRGIYLRPLPWCCPSYFPKRIECLFDGMLGPEFVTSVVKPQQNTDTT